MIQFLRRLVLNVSGHAVKLLLFLFDFFDLIRSSAGRARLVRGYYDVSRNDGGLCSPKSTPVSDWSLLQDIVFFSTFPESDLQVTAESLRIESSRRSFHGLVDITIESPVDDSIST